MPHTSHILCGDWLTVLRMLGTGSVQCCVTSPPYWGLRDYGVAGQLGSERAPEIYVESLVRGFREVRRFPLAILATGLVILSAISFLVGLLLHAVNWRMKELHDVLTRRSAGPR